MLRDIKYLGVIRANPLEYVQAYGRVLKSSRDLPDFVHQIKRPQEVGPLAAEYKPRTFHELFGDLHALNLIDLGKEGLGAYRKQHQHHQPSQSLQQKQTPSLKRQSRLEQPATTMTSTLQQKKHEETENKKLEATPEPLEMEQISPSLTGEEESVSLEQHYAVGSEVEDEEEPALAYSRKNSARSVSVSREQSTSNDVLNNAFDYATQESINSKASSRKSSLKSSAKRKSSTTSSLSKEDAAAAAFGAKETEEEEGKSQQESRNVSFEEPATASEATSVAENANLNDLIAQIFQAIDTEGTGTIAVAEAEKTLLRLNTRLSKNYGEGDIKSFFESLDINQNGLLNFEDFRKAFLNIAQ